MAHQADFLLVTVTKAESRAVLDVFAEATKQKARPFEIEGRTCFFLGAINGASMCMTQSEMGAGGLDASHSETFSFPRVSGPTNYSE